MNLHDRPQNLLAIILHVKVVHIFAERELKIGKEKFQKSQHLPKKC